MGFFVNIVGRVRSMVNERETEENPFKPPTQPLYAPTDPPISVKIFLPSASGDPLLLGQDDTIFKSAELTNRARQILQKLQEIPQEQLKPKPLVTGADLIAAGYRPGPPFSKMLAAVEDAQLEGRIHSAAEALELVRERFQPR